MKTRSHIDFHFVEEHQRPIDARLKNWAIWCNGSGAPATSPMFRLIPACREVRGDVNAGLSTVDRMDAALLAKAVATLPAPHRSALNWAYVKPVNPRRACRDLGTTMEGLALLLRDGRQMLINRKA